jgi:hypothetical protein
VIEKHCIARGCRVTPNYGFGSLMKDTMRWACLTHVTLIWPGGLPLPRPEEGRAAIAPIARPSTTLAAQGRLI